MPSGRAIEMSSNEEFERKLAHFNAVKAEVEASWPTVVTQVSRSRSPGREVSDATNDMWVAGGGKPFLIPIDKAKIRQLTRVAGKPGTDGKFTEKFGNVRPNLYTLPVGLRLHAHNSR